MNRIMKIEGMSCGHCVGTVEKALRAVPGVEGVNVDLAGRTAFVAVGEGASDAALAAAVNDAGFEVVGIE